MTIRIRKYIALAICLLFTTGVVLGGSGVTLCIGDCGHSKFETVCLPTCGEAVHTNSQAALDEAHSEHMHCGYCSDVSVDGPQWLRRSRLTGDEQETVTTPACVAGTTRIFTTTPGSNCGDGKHMSDPPQDPAISQSTTVLQC